jgi:hypothetical protein
MKASSSTYTIPQLLFYRAIRAHIYYYNHFNPLRCYCINRTGFREYMGPYILSYMGARDSKGEAGEPVGKCLTYMAFTRPHYRRGNS